MKTAVASDTFNLTAASRLYLISVDAYSLDVAGAFDCRGCVRQPKT